jgi:hypothetical protein
MARRAIVESIGGRAFIRLSNQREWRAGQNKTANTYVIEIPL